MVGCGLSELSDTMDLESTHDFVPDINFNDYQFFLCTIILLEFN